MRKIWVVLISIGLLVSGTNGSFAATKPNAVVAAFKTLLSNSTSALDDLELQYESDVDALDAALVASTKDANATYDKELLAATTTYAPLLDAANAKVKNAKATYEANNKVRLTTGFFGPDDDRLVWSLDCLPPKANSVFKELKRYCAAVDGIPMFGDSGYGGEDWQPGDVTTIALRNADDKYVALGITKGFIVPVNLLLFDSSRIAYKQGLDEVATLTAQNGKARTAALEKRDKSIASANANRESALADLDDKYETDKSLLESQQEAANFALLAAKRAAKDVSIFDKAFATAFKFEYNRQMLDSIADAAWNGEWTYRTIDSVLKVNRLASIGDLIGEKYSFSAASSFNNSVGSAFTNEPDFRTALKVLSSVYKKATNTTLKLN